MKLFTRILLAAMLLTGSGYAYARPGAILFSDSLVTSDRHLSGFNALHVSGPFKVYLEQGNTESVTLDAPAEILNRIVTEVNGGVLRISNKHDNWGWGEKSWYGDKSWWRHHDKIVVHVTIKDLNGIKLSGSGDVFFKEGITSNKLNLVVRGSGKVEGKIDVKQLQSAVSGSGGIRLTGTAESSVIKLTGSGTFAGPELITSSSDIHVSGSGAAKVNASEKVYAYVSGSGGVSYTGSAKIVNSKKSGSGSINRF